MSIMNPKIRWPLSRSGPGAAFDVGMLGDSGVVTGVPVGVVGPSGSQNGLSFTLGTQHILNTKVLNWATWTISCWVNVAAFGAGRIVPVSFDDVGVLSDRILYLESNGILRCLSGSLLTSVLGGGVSLNTWTLLTQTYDGTTLNLYQGTHLDGTASGAAGAGIAGVYTRPALLVGGNSTDWAQAAWIGAVADVRADDSVASTGDIAALVANRGRYTSGLRNRPTASGSRNRDRVV